MDLLMLQVKNGFCVYHKISLNIILDISNKVMIFSPDYTRIMRNLKNAEFTKQESSLFQKRYFIIV